MSTPQKGRIFISYRRADSAGYAGRIYDRLMAHFGVDAVFMDVDTIEAGLDFVEVLQNAVQSCDVLIALIGRSWLGIKDRAGKRRLDTPEDFVRIEVAAALSRDIRVIPVLVDGAPMPRSTELPNNLKPLARRNALPVNHRTFDSDAYRLISQLELALKEAEEKKEREAAAKAAREMEERERKDREEKAQREREAREKAVAEERASLAAEQKAQKEHEEKERKEAEEKARKDALRKAHQQEVAERIKNIFRGRGKLLFYIGGGVIILFLLGYILTQLLSPDPSAISIGLSWEAEQGQVSAPFVVEDGVVSQNILTIDPVDGGQALYLFTIQDAGEYIVRATVNAPDASSNSFFVGMDTEPDSSMIWDISLTNGFEERTVTWRESALPDGIFSTTKFFSLTQGEHSLIIRGRESGVKLDKIEVAKVPTTTSFNTSLTETITPTNVSTTTPQTPTTQPTSTPAATATPTLGIGSTMISEKDGMVMVYVPAGEFQMGTNNGESDERPAHTVYLDAFWIDQTEVTNEMFAVFLDSEGNQSEGGVTWLDTVDSNVRIEKVGYTWQVDFGYENHPVIETSWYGAKAYCEWVRRRLPTEAEWEKAARGTDERVYPWGDTYNESYANYNNDIGDTTVVGSYKKGIGFYSAYDMAGNVWEWVADWYDSDYYGNSPNNNPTGPSSGEARVLRGGSWGNNAYDIRSARRLVYFPASTVNYIGFRCARDAE